MGKKPWTPDWDRENRKPTFIKDVPVGERVAALGGNSALWGNPPALDVLRLGSNEGEDYQGDIRLLFAGVLSSDVI